MLHVVYHVSVSELKLICYPFCQTNLKPLVMPQSPNQFLNENHFRLYELLRQVYTQFRYSTAPLVSIASYVVIDSRTNSAKVYCKERAGCFMCWWCGGNIVSSVTGWIGMLDSYLGVKNISPSLPIKNHFSCLSPVTVGLVLSWSWKDPILSKVISFTFSSRPTSIGSAGNALNRKLWMVNTRWHPFIRK